MQTLPYQMPQDPDNSFPREAACIAVVEDDQDQAQLIDRWLRGAGHRVELYPDGASFLANFPSSRADAVILDMHLPSIDGMGVLEALRSVGGSSSYLPILMLTGDVRASVRRRALSLGTSDFLSKPVDKPDLLLRVGNHLRIRYLTQQLEDARSSLEERLVERSRELIAARAEILDRLARAAEYRDDATGQHARRVGALSGAIARALGLPKDQAALIEQAAPLHDVGKIGIPDPILLKPGRFTDEERAVMERHTTIGADILGGSEVPVLQTASEIAATHHEWWNGNGALGLRGEEIPISGRIVGVADVFDALTHERPYKKAWDVADALTEIRSGAGTRHDPRVVEALHDVVGIRIPLRRELAAEDAAHAA